jgi:hypothetical protein
MGSGRWQKVRRRDIPDRVAAMRTLAWRQDAKFAIASCVTGAAAAAADVLHSVPAAACHVDLRAGATG